MICPRCKKRYSARAERCPHCGEAAAAAGTGVFQTSTVLISSGGADLVYRSVQEVPQPLRHKLLKSTNSSNSATILIADRRGRQEIARAMRSLPGPVQRRLMQAVLGDRENAGSGFRLTPWRRLAIGVLFILAVAVIMFSAFAHR
jgi:hypothetical protein